MGRNIWIGNRYENKMCEKFHILQAKAHKGFKRAEFYANESA
jgi:hypothetical protein